MSDHKSRSRVVPLSDMRDSEILSDLKSFTQGTPRAVLSISSTETLSHYVSLINKLGKADFKIISASSGLHIHAAEDSAMTLHEQTVFLFSLSMLCTQLLLPENFKDQLLWRDDRFSRHLRAEIIGEVADTDTYLETITLNYASRSLKVSAPLLPALARSGYQLDKPQNGFTIIGWTELKSLAEKNLEQQLNSKPTKGSQTG